MKQSRWMTFSTAIAVMALSAAIALVPGLAAAEQQHRSHTISSERWGNLQPDGRSTHPVYDRKSRITTSSRNGRRLSLVDGDKAVGFSLGTAVILRPLQTDRFTMAFTASKPLAEEDNRPTTERLTMPGMRMHESDNQIRFNIQSPDRRIEWLVFTNAAWATPFESIVLEPAIKNVYSLDMESGGTSQLALVLLPADQWTVRALVSMEHHDLNSIVPLSPGIIDQSRMTIAIGVDYKILDSMRIDIGYGIFRNARPLKNPLSNSDNTQNPTEKSDSMQIQIFSARLKIKF